MKLLALIFLIIGSLAANQAFAEDLLIQPLTRAHCDEVGMAWDDNANVCAAKPSDLSRQPLTRLDCVQSGMAWNDKANVCGQNSGGPATQTASQETNPAGSAILINIDKTRQRMTVSLDGVQRYQWPVSTGRPGYSTPSGDYVAGSMNETWYSKQWDNAPMPHAVFFTKEGHAIHANEVKRLGTPASHGCVRISPQNAATLYALVAKNGLENTHVTLVGLTPGGEGKAPRSFKQDKNYDAEADARPQRRGGFFKRFFGGS